MKNRLLSLDIMRGITIAGMIMVNNPGSWSNIYAPLRHVSWHGLTPTDLVFPFFMFIMGVSMYLSMSKTNFAHNKDAIVKVLRRSVVIFAIGIGIAWFSGLCYSTFNISSEVPIGERFVKALLPWESIRILGVMQRLALSYLFASLIAMYVPFKHILKVVGGILLFYWLLLAVGENMDFSENSWIYKVDNALIGANHLYKDSVDGVRLAFDPEGLLSTAPCIAHVLLGLYCGKLLQAPQKVDKIANVFIFGTIMLFAGLLLSYGCPINKKIWTPTFVLATCGLGSLLLGLLIWIIDIRGKQKWSRFFEAFGINPLFMYVMGAVLSILLGSIRFPIGEKIWTVKGYIYDLLVKVFVDPTFASLVFALLFISLNWAIGYQLYKRKIYIKI